MDDLISRRDAIEVINAILAVTGDKNVAKVWDQIKDLPSAQPERKTGQWQEDPNGYGFWGYGFWICSACGFVLKASGADSLYNFCPNCGADMSGRRLNE